MAAPLKTVRDAFRFAVAEFARARVCFGHGATTAADEAAFMVLEGLALPIGDINPFLDRRLAAPERARLAELIAARVATRQPAAYLLGKAYIAGVPFFVDERALVPRSFIGELLADGFFDGAGSPLGRDAGDVSSVLDLCTGSGCLAIFAAAAFPNAHIDAADISADALALAHRNVAEHGLDARIALHEGDLFAPVATRRFDVIIANPPYVGAQAMAALPPEYRAEPALGLAGGTDGLDIVRRILSEAPARLAPGGGLVCEIGAGRGLLEAERPDLDFLWLDTEESAGEVFCLTGAGAARSSSP